MNLDFSEEQEMLRAMAREFLSKECPKALVRQMEEDEKGMPRDLWAKMADLGWLGLVFPEKYGGSGGSFVELAILLEEMGRVLLPGPFLSTVVLCGLPVLEAGSERQKRDLLTGIASGDVVMSLALTEPSAQYTPGAITVSASTVRDGYSIKGTKLFVADALVADRFLVAARTKESAAPEDGVSLLLVDARSQGIRCTPLVTIAADRQCEVAFDAVKAKKED
ncbi:MAG: acyl-CoA dehydrogenase family protein, partial [Chloroflexota bacterium]